MNASNKTTIDGIYSVMKTGFDNIGQALNELLDNSVSAISGISAGNKNIYITFEEGKTFNGVNDLFIVSVEDTGVGFSESDINNVFSIGNKGSGISSINIHGAGMKYALFSATCSDALGNTPDVWTIFTRTKELKSHNKYLKISAPFVDDIEYDVLDEATNPWPGEADSNTIVSFYTTREFIKKIGDSTATHFSTWMDYIYEDVGYTYSNIISGNHSCPDHPLQQGIHFYLRAKDVNGIYLGDSKRLSNNFIEITPCEPEISIEGKSDLGKEIRYDLDTAKQVSTGGTIIRYTFAQIKSEKDARDRYKTRNDHLFDNKYHRRHYRPNAKNLGVEIRINGRVLRDNLLPEIWDVSRHSSYYRFLGRIDVISKDIQKLPETKALKVDFNSGLRYLNLIKIIRDMLSKNELESYKTDVTPIDLTEKELVDELIEYYKKLNTPMSTDQYDCIPSLDASGKRTCDEECIDLGISPVQNPMSTDLIVTCTHSGGAQTTWLIECKRNEARPENIAQLAQYCLTISRDIDKAVLVTSDSPSPSPYIIELVERWNRIFNTLGKPYEIECMSWDSFGIKSKKTP